MSDTWTESDMESLNNVLKGHRHKSRMTWWEECYSMMSPDIREAIDKSMIDYIKTYGGEIEIKRIEPVKTPKNIAHELSIKYFGKK